MRTSNKTYKESSKIEFLMVEIYCILYSNIYSLNALIVYIFVMQQ